MKTKHHLFWIFSYIFACAAFAWVSGIDIQKPLEWIYIAFISGIYFALFKILSGVTYPKLLSSTRIPKGATATFILIITVIVATAISQLLKTQDIPKFISNSLPLLIIISSSASLGVQFARPKAEQGAAANP